MDDNYTITDTGKGFSLFYKERTLYSKTNPVESCINRVQAFDIKPGTLVLLPSPVFFYGLSDLIKKLPPESEIICLECDEKLHQLSMAFYNALDKEARRPYYFIKNPPDIIHILKKYDLSKLRKIRLLILNGAYNLNKNFYDLVFSKAEEELRRYWHNRFTLLKMGTLWIKNIFKNLQQLPETENLNELKTDKAVLIAGAGPSLEGSLKLIRNSRNDYYIICLDTALSPLLNSGIKPDLVFILEAQHYNMHDFYGHELSELSAAFDLSSNPAAVRLFSKNRYFFISEFTDSNFLKKISARTGLPVFPALGSVGVTAVYFAVRYLKQPIHITGLDFSYQLGKSHAKNAYSHKLSLFTANRFNPAGHYNAMIQRQLIKLKDLNSNFTFTDTVMHSYYLLFLEIIGEAEKITDLRKSGLPLIFNTAGKQTFYESPLINKLTTDNVSCRNIIEEEITSLEKVLNTLRKKNNKTVLEFIPDYLFYNIPDNFNWNNPNHIKQLEINSFYFLKYLKETAARF